MKNVLNKTRRPLKVQLSQGKVLHLGPGKEGQIATGDEELASLKKLLSDGELEIVGEGSYTETGSARISTGRLERHGHHPSVAVKKRGDR